MEDKQKVIFIEDDPNLGLIIVLALQSKGYEVCYANTLSGIQDMIEKDCPNILLLDLEVGNQNALDYLPFIRSKHPSLPVLIASSHNEGEEITRCYEAGANHYTKKPYDIQEIDFLIQRFCKKGSPISNSISIGDYQLELSTHKLFYKYFLILHIVFYFDKIMLILFFLYKSFQVIYLIRLLFLY